MSELSALFGLVFSEAPAGENGIPLMQTPEREAQVTSELKYETCCTLQCHSKYALNMADNNNYCLK